jgi:integrase
VGPGPGIRVDPFLEEPHTAEEVERLADAAGSRWRAMILVMGFTGARIAEVSGLRTQHVDLDARTIRIMSSAPGVEGRKLLDRPTKTRRRRSLTLPQFVADEIRDYLEDYPAGRDDLVFRAPGGGPVRQGNFRNRVMRKAAEKAEVFRVVDGKRVHPHPHDSGTPRLRSRRSTVRA